MSFFFCTFGRFLSSMIKSELISRLSDIEWEDFEVKEARTDLPKNIWETVSAFSNTSGGWIVLGVKQNGQSFEIQGVAQPEKLEQDFIGTLRSQKFNTHISCKAVHHTIDSKHLLLFYIPSADNKPVYFGSPVNTFIRMGSGDQRASEEELSSMFRDRSYGKQSELPVEGTSIEMLSKPSLQGYRRYFESANPNRPYTDLDDEQFCRLLNITTDSGTLTYAGLLMFGKGDEVLRRVPTFCMDYIEFPAKSVELSPVRYSYRIPEPDNLWDAYLVVARRMEGLVNRPYRVNERGIGVSDMSAYEVLREAWLNMLMHTDHFSSMRSCVHVFTDHIEFMNAGTFPIPLEQMENRFYSNPRNPTIAKLFRFTGLCENAGYGMDKLRSWKRITGCDLSIDVERTMVITTFRFPSDTNQAKDPINDPINDPIKSITLIERAIVNIIKEHPSYTRSEIAQQLKVSEATIKRAIQKLIDKKLVQRKGSNKTGPWEIIDNNQ